MDLLEVDNKRKEAVQWKEKKKAENLSNNFERKGTITGGKQKRKKKKQSQTCSLLPLVNSQG